ncbi:PilZ domain-containing protein [Palleronia aestuarii]|uniref:PilZ domain-containing protein n=1 Tax=Palleronia aestuarii TaxID=568105 RepID=A0A2W7NZC5_9RHOB|nr:PilZ domain-containing protein [Palleronia aestuarii]PZX16562.1 PilZ domain-containing protein [Palleronia aestuarii]
MFKRSRRWPSDARVHVIENGETIRASVSDVSEGGLQLECAQIDRKQGETLKLMVSGLTFTGTIRWRGKASYGLSFQPELSLDILRELTSGAYRGPDRGRGAPLMNTL